MNKILHKLTSTLFNATGYLPGGRYIQEIFSNKEIISKLAFTLLIIVIFRLLASIPLPGIDMSVYQQQFGARSASEAQFLLTIFTGGRLDSPSIVGLGIGVYIVASIIIQLLTSVIPRLEELSKEGTRGKQIIDQYTRYLTLPLGLLYAVGYLFLLAQQNFSTDANSPIYLIKHDAAGNVSTMNILFMAIVLTAGSLLVMWLAELITERGLGNGASLFIMLGIIASLPALVVSDLNQLNIGVAVEQVLRGSWEYLRDPSLVALYIFVFGGIFLISIIILITESTRKLLIQYARRVRGAATAQESFLPLKLNQSGVMPIIFASSLLTTPQLFVPLLIQVAGVDSPVGRFAESLQSSFLFDTTTAGYNITYFVLIILFSFFYAFVALKPADLAENLQKSGGFIPGIRPGKSTEQHITRIMIRLTTVGAIFLGFIALIPIVGGNTISNMTGTQISILSAIGGTSILIVIGVVLETARQLDSLRTTQRYDKFI